MKEQFTSFDIAQRLERLGFNEKCLNIWFVKSKEISFKIGFASFKNSSLGAISYISAPLIQQAINFLREKYGKFPIIFSDGFKWTYDLRWADPKSLDPYPRIMFPKNESERNMFDTYQEAELKAIEKLIEIVENETSKTGIK